MKKLITIILLFTSIHFSQEFWEPTNGPSLTTKINSIVACDDGGVYALTSYPETILYGSKDNGKTWDIMPIPTGDFDIISKGPDGIYLIKNYPRKIYKTTDPQNGWEEVTWGALSSYKNLTFNLQGDLFVCNGDGLYKSSDQGANWTQLLNGDISDFVITDDGYLYSVKKGIGIYKSTDSGNSWVEINQGLIFQPHYYHFLTSFQNAVYLSGYNGIYKYSEDTTSWIHILGFLDGYCITTNDQGHIFAVTDAVAYTAIYRSLDDGVTWDYQILDIDFGNASFAESTNGALFVADANSEPYSSQREGGLYRSINNGETWEKHLPLTIIDALCCNIDDNIFAAHCTEIFKTSDTGDSWKSIHYDAPSWSHPNLGNVYCITSNSNGEIFAGTFRCGILRSSDNGEHWTTLISSGVVIYSISIDSNDHIYAGTSLGILKSVNNGDNWTYSSVTDTVKLITINSSGDLFAVTSTGILRSSDDGENWVLVNNGLPNEIEILCICTKANNTLFVVTDASIFRSVNNGDSWENISSELLENKDILCITTNKSNGKIFVGTAKYGVYHSTDNGENWNAFSNGLPFNIQSATREFHDITALVFDNDNYLYAGTDGKGVFKSINPLVSVEEYEELPEKFILSQNYPNPFNPTTTIKYNIPSVETLPASAGKHAPSLQTELIVYDILGKKVATLFNENKQPGIYELDFNAANLPSGVYFYKLKAGKFSETKKMLLIK